MAKVLVIGSGGREHAIVHALSRSAKVEKVFCATGNPGIARLAENIPLSADDYSGLVAFAVEQRIDLTIVGPEAPLCGGIVDRFATAGLRIFGPTAAAARIEGDKGYAKRLMKLAHVPTAEARVFERYKDARAYVASRDTAMVVKAAGLTAGKGVTVCEDPADALLVLEKLMVERVFGDAGKSVVVEERLKGAELSVFALVSDRTIYVLETAQDHKAVGDGDTGPNTGGMGAHSPAPLATSDVLAMVEREVLVPIVDAMRTDGAPYSGVLYAGLMLTPGGPKVLEFNCRFGDPEAQVILPRIASDPYEMFEAVVDGRLDTIEVKWRPETAVCVVMASKGYPGSYETGREIEGIGRAEELKDVFVYQAGTRRVGRHVATSGGRVLGVTALGADVVEAKRKAYEGVAAISFDGAHYRRDISDKALGGR